ncbi:divalent-cation tolerance protein CutA [Chloroflexota bacterium]
MAEETIDIIVFVTTTNEDEANEVGKLLLSQRQAGCVNIVPKVNSIFWWKGEIESAQESLLIIKTKISFLKEIIRLVKEVHSYDVPEIIALPVIGGNQDYLDWVGIEVGKSNGLE